MPSFVAVCSWPSLSGHVPVWWTSRKPITVFTTCKWLLQMGVPVDDGQRPAMCLYKCGPRLLCLNVGVCRERLARLKSRLDIEMVRRYTCRETQTTKIARDPASCKVQFCYTPKEVEGDTKINRAR